MGFEFSLWFDLARSGAGFGTGDIIISALGIIDAVDWLA